MRKLRATDVKQNTYVHLPKSQGVQYESGLEMRRNKYLSVFRDYVRKIVMRSRGRNQIFQLKKIGE